MSGRIAKCPACEGAGRILLVGSPTSGSGNQPWELCNGCHGTGEMNEEEVLPQPAKPVTNSGKARQGSLSSYQKEHLKQALAGLVVAGAMGVLAGSLDYGQEDWQFWVVFLPVGCAVAFALPGDRPMGMHDVWMCVAGIVSGSVVALMLSAAFPPPEIPMTREFCEDAITRGSEFESRNARVRDSQRLCRGIIYQSPGWNERSGDR